MDESSGDDQLVGGNVVYTGVVNSVQSHKTDPMALSAATDGIDGVLRAAVAHELQIEQVITVLNVVCLSLSRPSDDKQQQRDAKLQELTDINLSLNRRLSDLNSIKCKIQTARLRYATSDIASETIALLVEFALSGNGP